MVWLASKNVRSCLEQDAKYCKQKANSLFDDAFFSEKYTSEKLIDRIFGSAEKTIHSRVWNMILKVQLMFEQTVSDL